MYRTIHPVRLMLLVAVCLGANDYLTVSTFLTDRLTLMAMQYRQRVLKDSVLMISAVRAN